MRLFKGFSNIVLQCYFVHCEKDLPLLTFLFLILLKETPNGHKKKIIPVGSDFEGSPSPEFPSSPSETPKMVSELEENKKNKKMNFKWKSSVSKFYNFVLLFF